MARVLTAAIMLLSMTTAHAAAADGSGAPDDTEMIVDSPDEAIEPTPTAEVPAPILSGYKARVRLTYYVESGLTYSGRQTYSGATACSWNWPLYTRFMLPDGDVFTCIDRGMLGSNGWLDLWRRPDLVRDYGPYALVTVLN